MSEQLYIRLGNTAESVIHWMVWSNSENEIIASGELPHVDELATLQSRAGGRAVTVLVPGNDVLTKQVEMPPKAGRQFAQAIPYMLEDELAQDVDDLFFATGSKVKRDDATFLNVAICAKDKMEQWLTWLTNGNIVAQQLVPDFLALPQNEQGLSAIQLGQEWIVRQSEFSGFNVAQEQLQQWVAFVPQNEEQTVSIAHYSPLPESGFNSDLLAEPRQYDLPLQVLANGLAGTALNLRQGAYQLQKDTWKFLSAWRNVAILGAVFFVVHLSSQLMTISALEQQTEQIEKDIRKSFLKAFPAAKKVRTNGIRKYMKSKLKGVDSSGSSAGFFTLVEQGQQAFKQVKDLRPVSFKYDGKRDEIRVQANGKSFANFETFKSVAVEQGLSVEQGSLNNNKGVVSGTLIIKRQ